MNPKERYFAGMARATIGKITSNRENWTGFLNTMAQNYSFTYPEQVMIYAQRPNATMCKPYDEWNSPDFKRYVKRGSTGIAMFIGNSEKPALRYVFDVADTGVRRSSPVLKPWQVTDENRNFVMEAMEKSFGIPSDGVLEAQLEEIANALVNEYWQDYKKPISDIIADSFLEEYDDYNIEVAFKRAAANSVSYAMYTRLTENPDNYFEHEDFLNVFDFNTRQTVNALGTAVNQISTRMFLEIEKAIHEYELSKNAERSMNHDERDDLQPQRGLSDPEHHAGEYRNETPGQVRQDAQSVPGAEQPDAVERSDPHRAAVSAPVGDRRDSAPQSRAVDAAVSDAEPGPGQSEGSDGMGAAHEQPESTGRGSRDDGAYQQLSLNLFLSEEGQIKFIDEAESRKPSAFSFTQDEIDHILQLGVNEDEGRMIVVLDYMKQKPIEQIAENLKTVYHGGFGLKDEKRNISAWYSEDGIRLAQGDYAERNSKAQTISWEDAAKRIGELLDAGQYATNVELEEALGYERTQVAEKLWYFAHDFSEGTADKYMFSLQDIRGFRGGFPDATQHLANMLTEESIRYGLKRDLREFIEAYQENPSLLRFHYHKLNQLEQRLQELDLPIKEYHSELTAVPLMRRFITDDELNAALCRGSGVEGGKARIYEYWQANHTKQEKAEWLKNEYGTGGRSHALSGTSGSGEDHDARGMSFTKAGCEKVQFTWAQIAARLDNLMLNDLYLTADEKAKLEQYHAAQAPKPVVSYNEYNEIKEKHPDSIVLYQVGDFFEMYGEDAKIAAPILELTLTTKAIPDVGRVEMCGFPAYMLDQMSDKLRDKYDVTIAAAQEYGAEHRVYSMPSIDHEAEQAIDAHEAEFGADGYRTFREPDDLDHIDPIALRENLAARGIENGEVVDPEKLDNDPFIQQVMADVERIAAETEVEPDDRFAIVEVEGGGYVIWDNNHDGVYVDETGVGEQQPTLEEAEAYLAAIQSKERDKAAAEWEYMEHEKFLASLDEPAIENASETKLPWNYQIGDTVYLEGDPYTITDITQYHVELLPPGQGYPIYRSENKENFERLLAMDDRNSTHKAEKMPEPAYKLGYGHLGNGLTVWNELEQENGDYKTVAHIAEDRTVKFYDEKLPQEIKDEIQHKANTAELNISATQDIPVFSVAPIEEPTHFIDHYYVVENLQKRGPLDITEYSTFEDAFRAYQLLPNDKVKALGVEKVSNPLPGVLDMIQCIDGADKVIQDYTKVEGWENPEILEVVAKIEKAIETRNIPDVPAVNFRIDDDHLGEGGAKAKFRANMDAINLLKELEFDGDRNATPEEQKILSQYVGWGGLADAFDESKANWADEFVELHTALSPEEYEAARASTLNAHYTSPVVIRSMYDAVGQMGFDGGNILEPSMGIGNFFGMMPDTMRNSRLYGVELDPISGKIAQKLYPNADIKIAGFETTDRKDFYDLAVGNVPFGNYKVSDKPYDKLGFSIHNYFFAKALDQVRPGGIVAFVTSRFTMDSKNSDARRYMAQKAELLGAIRLPNNAFKANAGTDVVSDIIFLQKRDRPLDIVPEWVNLTTTPNGMTMNSYFAEHPEMVMGDLAMESTPYGKDDLTVRPRDGVELSDLLKEAVTHICGEYHAVELTDTDEKGQPDTIPATPDVKNFSYGVVDGEVYFRENSVMRHVETNEKAKERIIGMVELRRIVNELMDYQLEDFPDEKIKEKQAELSLAYDEFSKQNGLINSRANALAFADDSSYYLLCSLENVDENGELESKADIFTKRTIKPDRKVTSVDTPSEALAISIGERGKVDLPFMAQLLGTPDEYETIISELQGVIFKDPLTGNDNVCDGWQTADEYLSGDVRNKLQVAQIAAKNDPSFAINVQALEKAQPKDLDASEIDVRLGATWIDPDYIQQFMQETFDTPYYLRRSIEVKFSELTAEWRISGKSSLNYNDVAAYTTYGTSRANAYRILEETLNLKDIRIYDTVEEADGKQKRVLNKKETTLAQQKQQTIKDAFRDWIWRDPKRREVLVQKYNVLFNSTRPREYDGSHIIFGGMNPEITLREHQRNAIAHVLYGGNTLLAHEVGAGKTFEMAASAMESKRLGLCQKSLFVVPNHLTLQWANEFLHLYPNAKLLVASKKDFETANRKKFCARIATGDYDAIIIGHSQFEKIPLSAERQERQLREQIDEIEDALAELKYSRGENFSIKQMEKTRKSLQIRLDKLTATDRKDDVVTFEQLGVDRLYVDESQAYKNLFLYTKMRNVAGLSTSEAQRSSDMFMKCRYLDELTGGRGVIFASGTPVSNSMTELYTVMRYLQYDTLQKKNLTHFDCWASTFGETTTAIELAPEGTGYRARTRFAKFFNLPELMNIFKEVADIKTSDQLHLPVPEAKFETVVVQPSEHQKQMVAELSERAAAVHSGIVDPTVDNMLKITSDGRKLGLDQRLMNPLLPDDPNSKLNACVQNVIRIWEEGKQEKLTQLLFCDMSTPKNDGTFNVYDDIKAKLLAHGIPENEVAFIHDADTEAKKKELFAKVRTGQVRVLLGSTQKMGAGTNCQDRLVAVHHLDVGWRPSDMTQRNGRIIRQGNKNKEVQIYQYVTEGTFDAYLYQTLENKQKFISQIMTSKSPVRSCDDVDEQALSYAEIKALCAGNPLIKEKMDLDIDVARLKVLKADHLSQRYRMEDKLLKFFPAEIEMETGFIKGFEEDLKTVAAHPQVAEGFCGMEIQGKQYTEKADAGELILAACSELKSLEPMALGSYRGFQMELSFDSFRHDFDIVLKGAMSHRVPLGTDARGNITRLDNALAAVSDRLEAAKERLEDLYNQQEAAKAEIDKPFPQEAELAEKSSRLAELDAALNMENAADHSAEKTDEGRPSVLADLKSRAENIPPYRHTDNREEVL